MKNIRVSDIMTRNISTVKPNTTITECAKKMIKEKKHTFPIVEKKKLIGIITQRDILWVLIKRPHELEKIKAIEISPKKLFTLNPNSTIEEVFRKVRKLKFEKWPVVKNKELVGILAIKDLLSFKPEIYPELEEFSKIKEETEKLKRLERTKKQVREGICEECGNVEGLYAFNGMLVCESCMGR